MIRSYYHCRRCHLSAETAHTDPINCDRCGAELRPQFTEDKGENHDDDLDESLE